MTIATGILGGKPSSCVTRHDGSWQLGTKLPIRAVRALAWFRPEEAIGVLCILKAKLPSTAKTELITTAPQSPTYLARLVGKLVHD